MEKHIKAKIDKLVEVYLNQLLSADSDAGWLNCSQWESMMDEIKSTSGDKDLRMINNCELIRHQHHKLPMAITAIRNGISDSKYRIALLCHLFYEGKVDGEGKVMTAAKVAKLIGCTLDQYKHNKKQAYQQMEMAVTFLAQYDHNREKAKVA